MVNLMVNFNQAQKRPALNRVEMLGSRTQVRRLGLQLKLSVNKVTFILRTLFAARRSDNSQSGISVRQTEGGGGVVTKNNAKQYDLSDMF